MLNLSIVIVSYNTKDAISQCIDSIISKIKIPDYEIIVVDNGSKDGSVKVLRDLWRKNKQILLIENKENFGFSKAVNQAIDAAKGKHILLLNSDTRFIDDPLTKVLDFVEKKDDAGVVGLRLLNEDQTIQPSCFNFPTLSNAFKEYILKVKGSYGKFFPKGNSPVKVEAVVGAAFLITDKARELVGKLDERYFMYMEDIDYCRRVYQSGLSVYYYPRSYVVHLHGESGKKQSKLQYQRLVASSKIYHGPLKYYMIKLILWLGQKISQK